MHSFTYQTGQSGVRNSRAITVKYLFILIAFFLCTPAVHVYAQKNARPATVFFSDGHTENGEIDYKDWYISPSEIQFRKDNSSAFTRLNPTQVNAFELHGDGLDLRYENHTVDVETTSLSAKNVFDKRVPDLQKRNVFLRCLVKGNNDLYSANFGFQDVFYVRSDNGRLFALINRRFEERGNIFTDSSYHQQIRDSLQLCADTKRVAGTNYTEKDLISLLKICGSVSKVYGQERAALKNDYGLFAGVALAQVRYREPADGEGLFPDRMNTDPSAGFQAGVFADINLSRSRKRYSLYFEGAYARYGGTARGTSRYNQDFTYDVRFDYFRLNSLFRYTFSPVPVFIQAGAISGFLLTARQTAAYPGRNGTQTRDIYESLRSFSVGAAGGLGYVYGRIGVQARYEILNGNSSYLTRTNTIQVFSAQVNYTLMH